MSYASEVRAIVDFFDYELCTECLRDLDAHAIEPDVLGHAGARCLVPLTEADLARLSDEALVIGIDIRPSLA